MSNSLSTAWWPAIRRVVTGAGDGGRSRIETDTAASCRLDVEALTVVDVWRTEVVPTSAADDGTPTGTPALDPPPSGVVARVCVFPPDEVRKKSMSDADARAHLDALGGGSAYRPSVESPTGRMIMHQTPSVDLIYVASGEIHAVMEDGETKLKPGDVFVQRGTNHAWSNRTSEPAVLFVVLLGAGS